MSNTPWTYYDYMFRLPLMEGASKNRNYGSYENPDAWALVQQLDKTPVDDVATMKTITSKLQKISLTDMPVIPLWYNGMWSQVSNVVWTNWPSDAGNHVLPCTWNGYWQMGAVLHAHAAQAGCDPVSVSSAAPLPPPRRGEGRSSIRRASGEREIACDATSGASSSSTC